MGKRQVQIRFVARASSAQLLPPILKAEPLCSGNSDPHCMLVCVIQNRCTGQHRNFCPDIVQGREKACAVDKSVCSRPDSMHAPLCIHRRTAVRANNAMYPSRGLEGTIEARMSSKSMVAIGACSELCKGVRVAGAMWSASEKKQRTAWYHAGQSTEGAPAQSGVQPGSASGKAGFLPPRQSRGAARASDEGKTGHSSVPSPSIPPTSSRCPVHAQAVASNCKRHAQDLPWRVWSDSEPQQAARVRRAPQAGGSWDTWPPSRRRITHIRRAKGWCWAIERSPWWIEHSERRRM